MKKKTIFNLIKTLVAMVLMTVIFCSIWYISPVGLRWIKQNCTIIETEYVEVEIEKPIEIIKEVIKEVEVEKIIEVEKEVIKEVEVEKIQYFQTTPYFTLEDELEIETIDENTFTYAISITNPNASTTTKFSLNKKYQFLLEQDSANSETLYTKEGFQIQSIILINPTETKRYAPKILNSQYEVLYNNQESTKIKYDELWKLENIKQEKLTLILPTSSYGSFHTLKIVFKTSHSLKEENKNNLKMVKISFPYVVCGTSYRYSYCGVYGETISMEAIYNNVFKGYINNNNYAITYQYSFDKKITLYEDTTWTQTIGWVYYNYF